MLTQNYLLNYELHVIKDSQGALKIGCLEAMFFATTEYEIRREN